MGFVIKGFGGLSVFHSGGVDGDVQRRRFERPLTDNRSGAGIGEGHGRADCGIAFDEGDGSRDILHDGQGHRAAVRQTACHHLVLEGLFSFGCLRHFVGFGQGRKDFGVFIDERKQMDAQGFAFPQQGFDFAMDFLIFWTV